MGLSIHTTYLVSRCQVVNIYYSIHIDLVGLPAA